MDSIDQIISEFQELTFPLPTPLPEATSKTLDGIFKKIATLSDVVTTATYTECLKFLRQIPDSYYEALDTAILKELITSLDRGNVRGAMTLFRVGTIGDSLDQVMGLNSALSAYILRVCLWKDESWETLEALIQTTTYTSLLRNCFTFILCIDLLNEVPLERIKQFGYLNRTLYVILEYGKRFVQNYQEIKNDEDEKFASSEERAQILAGFHAFLHENLGKIVEILRFRIKLKNVETKMLSLEDTVGISKGVIEWKPFNDWELSHKHYLLCFLGNLIQGIMSFALLKYLTKTSREQLLTGNFHLPIIISSQHEFLQVTEQK
jgi:hypothetical protein